MKDPHSLMWYLTMHTSGCRRTSREYVLRGDPIPEHMLPGRLLMMVSPETRAQAVIAANSTPADWWIKQVLS